MMKDINNHENGHQRWLSDHLAMCGQLDAIK